MASKFERMPFGNRYPSTLSSYFICYPFPFYRFASMYAARPFKIENPSNIKCAEVFGRKVTRPLKIVKRGMNDKNAERDMLLFHRGFFELLPFIRIVLLLFGLMKYVGMNSIRYGARL